MQLRHTACQAGIRLDLIQLYQTPLRPVCMIIEKGYLSDSSWMKVTSHLKIQHFSWYNTYCKRYIYVITMPLNIQELLKPHVIYSPFPSLFEKAWLHLLINRLATLFSRFDWMNWFGPQRPPERRGMWGIDLVRGVAEEQMVQVLESVKQSTFMPITPLEIDVWRCWLEIGVAPALQDLWLHLLTPLKLVKPVCPQMERDSKAKICSLVVLLEAETSLRNHLEKKTINSFQPNSFAKHRLEQGKWKALFLFFKFNPLSYQTYFECVVPGGGLILLSTLPSSWGFYQVCLIAFVLFFRWTGLYLGCDACYVTWGFSPPHRWSGG